jgi:tetratricopeptide (TPR) repeat protein
MAMKLSSLTKLTVLTVFVALLVIACGGGGGNTTLAKLNRDVKATPDAADVYVQRGLYYLETAEFEKAVQDFRQASSVQGNNAEYHVYCARAYLGLKEYDNALARLLKARMFNVNQQDAYWVHGQVFSAQGLPDAALAQFDTAVGIDRKKVEPYLKRADFLVQTQHFADAQKDIAKAISLDSNNAATYSMAGRVYAALNKPDSTFIALDRAALLDSMNPLYLSDLARAYYDRRDKNSAAKYYNQALKYKDRLPEAVQKSIEDQLQKLQSE